MAAALQSPDSRVCFAELIVRLDSLLTLRPSENVASDENDGKEAQKELENGIKLKLNELHLRLKNGGSVHDRSLGGAEDDDDEDEAVDDSQGPCSAPEGGVGSVDCVGCSSAEDDNEAHASPVPHHAPNRSRKRSMRSMKLMNHDNINALMRLCILVFSRDNYTNETLALAAQLIAEICRENDGRKTALRYKNSEGLTLVQGIGRVLARPRSAETCVQICRIIGNICFDCPEGRNMIIAEASNIFEPLVQSFEKSSLEDPGQRLPVIFPGCLLNFCNDTPKAVEVVAKYNCAEAVLNNILATKTNDAVFNSSILFIHSIVECETGIEHLVRCPRLPRAICHILQHTTSPELCSTLFDLLKTCSESPALVLHLAKGGLFNYMVTHMNERLQSEAFLQLRITACDVLVTMLAHDEAMQFCYDHDSLFFLSTFLDWLKNGEDHPLKTTAALCIGNFCCSSKNCQEVIHQVAPALIQALVTHQAPLVRDVKMQHAILGALRNLTVDPVGRPVLIKAGLVQPCLALMAGLSLTPITQPVVMKLMAIIRLMVDSEQDVSRLLSQERPEILSQIIAYSNHEGGGPGPKAEAGRLLAGILKNCKSTVGMKNLVTLGGLPAVTVMLHSSHPRMLNEALVALSVLSACLVNSEPDLIHQHLHTDLVINGVKRSLNNKELPGEIKANAATLILTLLKVHHLEFKQMLIDLNFAEECFNCEDMEGMPQTVQDLANCLK